MIDATSQTIDDTPGPVGRRESIVADDLDACQLVHALQGGRIDLVSEEKDCFHVVRGICRHRAQQRQHVIPAAAPMITADRGDCNPNHEPAN